MNNVHLLPTGRFDTILLATDGSDFSRGAEQLAPQLAARCQSTLHAFRMVMTNPEYEYLVPELVAKQTEETRGYLENLCQQARATHDITCQPMVREGVQPHEAILQASEELQADLIIMGRRGRRGLARLMVGDATARVVGQAQCMVLVVPQAATMWQKGILVATDGSRYSDRAAVVAVRLAQRTNVPLTVLSVVRKDHSREREQAAQALVAKVAAHAREQGIDATTLVKRGQPEEEIAATVQERGLDLVVGGSHGRTGMERILLGSVMERVIGTVSCPVLAVKGG